MRDIEIVSAVYDIGWRGPGNFFTYLKNVSFLNPDIKFTIYTNLIDKCDEHFATLKNVDCIDLPIKNFVCYEDVIRRCEYLTDDQKKSRFGVHGYLPLMHEKVNFLSRSKSQYKFWMDAHVFSNQLLPSCYLDRCFDTKMMSLDLFHAFKVPHVDNIHGVNMSQFKERPYYGEYMIGGFWGGKSRIVKEFVNNYKLCYSEVFSHGVFGTDENVLIFSNDSKLKNVIESRFEQWFHQESRLLPGDEASPMKDGLVSFCDVFSKYLI